MEEPSDAVLSQLMKEAAEEAMSLSSTLRKFMLLRGYFSI